MPVDIIVYALVAAGLIFWLRSILGTRHGDERSRPNPYEAPPENANADDALSGTLPMDDRVPTPEDKVAELAKNPMRGMSIEGKSAEAGLLDITKADKDFDINFFLEGAQEAFVIVVEAFGEGDRDTLNGLLAPNVFDAFDQAIAEREKNDETMQTEIHAIKKAEITDARLDRKTALITVRFTAEETSVIKDSNGEIVSGHPDKVTQMRDMWVFSREVRARDPRWFLHETKGDFDGDNETIPNSDGQ